MPWGGYGNQKGTGESEGEHVRALASRNVNDLEGQIRLVGTDLLGPSRAPVEEE